MPNCTEKFISNPQMRRVRNARFPEVLRERYEAGTYITTLTYLQFIFRTMYFKTKKCSHRLMSCGTIHDTHPVACCSTFVAISTSSSKETAPRSWWFRLRFVSSDPWKIPLYGGSTFSLITRGAIYSAYTVTGDPTFVAISTFSWRQAFPRLWRLWLWFEICDPWKIPSLCDGPNLSIISPGAIFSAYTVAGGPTFEAISTSSWLQAGPCLWQFWLWWVIFEL